MTRSPVRDPIDLNRWIDTLASKEFEPEDWAPACAGLLLGIDASSESWRTAFDRLERVVALGALREDPLGRRALELSRVFAGPPIAGLPAGHLAFPDGFVALPRRAERNGAYALSSPEEVRRALRISRDDPSLTKLARMLKNYMSERPEPTVPRLQDVKEKRSNPPRFVCGVQPHVDTILATVAIYAASDCLGDDVVDFEPVGWAEVPGRSSMGDLDFSYGWQSAFAADQYYFHTTKTRTSRMPCLRNTRKPPPQGLPICLNFIGSYSLSNSGPGNPDLITIDYEGEQAVHAFARPVDAYQGATETQTLSALAAGLLPAHCVVPTNAGYLWCAEAGLMYRKIGKQLEIGSLECGEVRARSTADAVGFGVRGKMKIARDLVPQLVEVVEKISRVVHESVASTDPASPNAASVLGALKAPILRAYDDDSGVLSGLLPKLALRMAYEGGNLYEQELDYKPNWWSTLSRHYMAPGTEISAER